MEDGRFTGLRADPGHPTGQALCIKGKVAPELVYHGDRLTKPLRRTRPKGDPDPGWREIGWDEALDFAADRLKALAADHGPECVSFTNASPSTSALSDSVNWIYRLRNAFGSPNHTLSMELCGWGRYLANTYSYGVCLPAEVMPDLENAGCILYWGYNPTVSRIAHATATTAAQKRGAKLIVVDPRQAGLARKADQWLRVRPGSDGALALGLIHVMIENGWYDADFLREWTNSLVLVRDDNGQLLPETATDLLDRRESPVACRTVFRRIAEMCADYSPARVETITGVPAAQITATAEMLWRNRPVAYMAWSGLEQQTNVTQVARAIGMLYALTGSFDAKGGNVMFPSAPSNAITGDDFLSADQRAKALGLGPRPLGPSRFGHATSGEVYRAILDREPYPVRGMVSFGSNLLMAHADGVRGKAALAALDFHLHADLFMNPSAEMADLVLPAASPFETEGLKIGFEVSPDACSHIQLRRPLVDPPGEARSDVAIVFDLACRLGLGDKFWDGDIDAAYRHQLAPSGIDLESLRTNPAGIRVEQPVRYRKYREDGFNTPSGKVELYSETLLNQGYPPLPDYEEPLVSPMATPELAADYPLILTCAKSSIYCESQHRALPGLRRRALEPEVELHPDAASARGIAEGDWVRIATPDGHSKAKAKFDPKLDPCVVCGQHGWWQACPELDAPGYDPVGPNNANFNVMISNHKHIDPISGSIPLRAYLCEVSLL